MANRYEVEIPATIRDETEAGARSVSTNIDKISQRAQLAGRAHYNLMHQLADKDAREQESNAKRVVAAEQQRYNEEKKLRAEAAAQRRAEEQEEVNAANRRMVRARQLAQGEATAANRRRTYARQLEQEEASAANRRQAYARQQAAQEEATARAAASRTRQAGIGLRNVGVGAVTAGAVLTGAVTTPLVGAAVASIADAEKMDIYRRALTAVGGSATDAQDRLEKLYAVAKMPGLMLDSAVQAQIRLQGVGFGADLATRTIATLGNAVALTGLETEKQKTRFDAAVNSLSQLSTRAKLTTQSLRTLITDSPEIAQAIQRAFGTLDPKVINTKVGSTQEFITRLVAAMERLPQATVGIQQKIANLMSMLEHEAARLGEKLIPLVERALAFLDDKLPKAIDFLVREWDALSPSMQVVVGVLIGLAAALGPVLTAIGFIVIAIGGFIAGVGAIASAVGGLTPLLAIAGVAIVGIGAAVAGTVAAGALLYAAWQRDFGGIREIVTTAWGAIAENTTRTVTLLEDAWQRLSPTLVSLAQKTWTLILAIWGGSGDRLLAVIRYISDTVYPIVRGILAHVLNVVELIARLADGDWRGAWDTFSVILYNATQQWGKMLVEAVVGAELAMIAKIVELQERVEAAVGRVAVAAVRAIATEIVTGYPKLQQALLTALVLAVTTLNFAIVGGAIVAGIADAMKRGADTARGREIAAQNRAAGTPDYGEEYVPAGEVGRGTGSSAGPSPGFSIAPTSPTATGRTADPAIEQTRILQDRLATVDKLASEAFAKVDRLYKFGIVGIATYTDRAEQIERERFGKVNAILDEEYAVAQSKQKGAAAAIADVDKRRVEESTKHGQQVAKQEDETLSLRLRLLEQRGQQYLQTQAAQDKRAIDELHSAAGLRVLTHGEAEKRIDAIERRAFDRTDTLLRQEQNLYATDSERFIDLAAKRADAAEKEADRRVAAEDRILAAIRQDIDAGDQFDEKMRAMDAGNLDLMHNINKQRIDQLANLGADPEFIAAQRSLSDAYDHYEDERRNLLVEKAKAMAGATGDERLQIEATYHQRELLLEEQHQVQMSDVMVASLQRYVEKINQIATDIGDVFGSAFGAIFQKGQTFWGNLESGFQRLWVQIVQDFISSRVKDYIESLFNPVYRATSGGGGGQGAGGILGSLGGGGGIASVLTGGFAGGNPAAALLRAFGGGGGGDVPTPASITGMSSAGGTASGGSLHELLHGVGMGGGLSKAGFGDMIGDMLPLLGAGIGSSLGGGSMAGQISGMAGGLIAGGALAAFLTPGIFGTGAFGAAIVPLLTNPITIAAGVALLAGAIILGRNARRKKDEATRNTISNDTGTAIWALIDKARLGDMTVADATLEWNKIHDNYFQQIASIKDGKTKRHAELQWQNDFAPLWKIVEAAATGSEERANIRNRMTPVFAGGGTNQADQLIRVRPGEGLRYPGSSTVTTVPGVDRGWDTQFMYAPRGMQVINRSDMAAGRGFAGGGTVGAGGGGMNVLDINTLELSIDADGIASAVIRSRHFGDAVIHKVKIESRPGGKL